MFRPTLPNVDLFWVILFYWLFLPEAGCRSADADSCHEVKTAYMMRQIGPVELVPDRPGTDEFLRVCVHPGPSCCTSKMEDSYMAAVRSETQQKMQSYSFELKYLIAGHTKAYQETFESLVSFTSNLTSTLFDSAYSSVSPDCRPLVSLLFSDIKRHLSGDSNSSLENTVRRFYNDLFPLVYHRLLNPGIGHTSPQSYPPPSTNQDDCLRMTRLDISPFGPHPRLLVSSLSRALAVGRALSRLLRLAGEVVNATEKAGLSRECGRGLVRMQYCSHCRGLTLIRPCTGLCINIMRGCLVGVSELGAPWGNLVVLLQRLAATLATSSGHNSMELALLAVRNHVNDAILHAQLHGPRITATVEKVCGPQGSDPIMPSLYPTTSHATTSVTPVASVTSERSASPPSVGSAAHQRLQIQLRGSFPLKGSRGDKPRSLKKLSREFQGSIQRYQKFFSELPEMLCESEMEVEQHTCWSGQDVVESYADRVVGSSLKAQKENPEMTVRNIDPGLREAKQKTEQLTQELLVELGWTRVSRGEEEEGGSGQRERGSGDECDDEDGCEASGEESGQDETASGRSPGMKNTPPYRSSPPQVAVRGSAHPLTTEPLPLTLMTLSLLLLSPWQPL